MSRWEQAYHLAMLTAFCLLVAALVWEMTK